MLCHVLPRRLNPLKTKAKPSKWRQHEEPRCNNAKPRKWRRNGAENNCATFYRLKIHTGSLARKSLSPHLRTRRERNRGSRVSRSIQHAGEREEIGLGSNDREAASRTAAKLYARVKAAGWTVALAEFAPDRTAAKGVPTVGEVIESASRFADIGANTLRGYVICFRKPAADAYGIHFTAPAVFTMLAMRSPSGASAWIQSASTN